MNKTTRISSIAFISAGTILALLIIGIAATQKAHAAITSELDFGSTGTEVTELQQFLATNPLIYPAGTVSGYFGPLTRAAVVQFQVAYDIPQVGRVGPMTQTKINRIMSSGFGLDTSVPVMGNASVQTNRTDATINWTTNEMAQGQVYYDMLPIQSNEVSRHAQQGFVSGTAAPNTAGVRNTQSITLQGLQPNTTYYYLTRAIDNSGNDSITLSNSFRTNQ